MIRQAAADFHSAKTQEMIGRIHAAKVLKPEVGSQPPYVLAGDFPDDRFLLHQVRYESYIQPYKTTMDKATGKRVPMTFDGRKVLTQSCTITYRKRLVRGCRQATLEVPGLVPAVLVPKLKRFGRHVVTYVKQIEVKCFPQHVPPHPRSLFPDGWTPANPPNRDGLIDHWTWETDRLVMRCYQVPCWTFGPMVEVISKDSVEAPQFDDVVRSAIDTLTQLCRGVDLRPVSSVTNSRGSRPYGRALRATYRRRNDQAQTACDKARRWLKRHGWITNVMLAELFAYAGERRWQRARDYARRNGLTRTTDKHGHVAYELPSPR
jgi:hypothetical protein